MVPAPLAKSRYPVSIAYRLVMARSSLDRMFPTNTVSTILAVATLHIRTCLAPHHHNFLQAPRFSKIIDLYGVCVRVCTCVCVCMCQWCFCFKQRVVILYNICALHVLYVKRHFVCVQKLSFVAFGDHETNTM